MKTLIKTLLGLLLLAGGVALGTFVERATAVRETPSDAVRQLASFHRCLTVIPAVLHGSLHSLHLQTAKQRAIFVFELEGSCAKTTLHGFESTDITKLTGYRFVAGNDLTK
ncbi:MAG TPA: hypothetical protein VGF98_00030 [Candidatus Tumulicola sp.]